MHRYLGVKGRDLGLPGGSQLTGDKANSLMGVDLALRFLLWESAVGRAPVTASSIGAWWGITSPRRGLALRIWEGYAFRSDCKAYAKLFWEVCPKQSKREAEEPSF